MEKKKIIYIAGLGHSGSTILDMVLGTHSKMIGLGEIMPFIRRKNHESDNKSTCSCGQKGSECEFWGKIENMMKKYNTEEEAYLKIADFFFDLYGNDTILVDSSKNSYSYLKLLNEKFDLKVIFLTRDFRSWAFSRYLSSKMPIFLLIFRWLAENKKLQHQLHKMNIDFFSVGYEEIAMYPDFALKKICEFVGVNFEPQMLNPAKTKSHIINGNVVRADAEKRSKIMYDARWLTSAKVSFNGLFFSILNRFNKKNVYSNVLGKDLKVDSFFLFSSMRKRNMDKLFN